jgi:hypothetical protein
MVQGFGGRRNAFHDDARTRISCQRQASVFLIFPGQVIRVIAFRAFRHAGQSLEVVMTNRERSSCYREKLAEGIVVVIAASIALLLARPYAGSWNDGSRLATVESLVEERSWSIDHSIFVQVPPPEHGTALPYAATETSLNRTGTLDKLFIDGHYYSDKSPVPALLLAGGYQLWKWSTGWTARLYPDRFCRCMTWVSSGFAYVLAVWLLYRLARRLRFSLLCRMILTGSFAFATVTLPYAQHVNNHILLLAVTSALTLGVVRFPGMLRKGRRVYRESITLGCLVGMGYTIDLGAGPVICVCTTLFVLNSCLSYASDHEGEKSWRIRFSQALPICLCFAASAIPWLVLHHFLNASIGGTFRPANANPEYFLWPSSPFAAENLTGRWCHDGIGSFLLYAASMLCGKRGFLGHNLPLFLVIPGSVYLLTRFRENRREVFWALGCCGGTWLLYAATSNNSSGQCCTIRWFVPLLAPAFLVVSRFLKRSPKHQPDFLLLSGWGALLVLLMHEGPWLSHMVPYFWPIQAAALLSWIWLHTTRLRRASSCGLYATSV